MTTRSLLVLSLGLFLLSPARGDDPAVWRMGIFDYSSGEFSSTDATGKPKRDVVFTIGKSQPVEWPGFQSLYGSARTVQFPLASLAPGYHMRVAFLIERPSLPALKVTINGRTGLFYLHPQLDYHGGDPAGSSRAGYSQATVEFDVPASFLKVGDNTATFQAVATGGDSVAEAGFNYDAIELSATSAPIDENQMTIDIAPTVFFHEAKRGLTEEVDVVVRSGHRLGPARIKLELGGNPQEQEVKGGQDFGEARVEFLVPEFKGEAKARATVTLNGQPTVAEKTIAAKKKWTIYIVSHIHLDLSYTDFMPKISSLHSRVLDEAMDLQTLYPEYRFSTDGQWVIDEFMRTRSAADQARLVAALKAGRIFSPAATNSILTGFPTAEVLIRSLYDAANFSRAHGTPFDYTTITDVPSYSWSYASVLASAGIHDFAAGSDNIRGPVLLKGQLHEQCPFWWEGPDKQKVLFWYAFVYRQVQMLFGLPPLVDAGHETLPTFLQSYEKPGYLANATIVYGTYGENRDLDARQATLVRRWNAKYAYPKLAFAGIKDAMTAIQNQFGDKIPTLHGDGGPYWEDGIGGNAINAAIARKTERRAPSAEKLATISSIVNPRVAPDKARLDEMWRNILLFDEHTGVPIVNSSHDDQKTIDWWSVKHSFAENGRLLSNFILQNSMGTIADTLGAPSNSLIVFNTLGWPRGGRVVADLQAGYDIVDSATGQSVPTRLLVNGTGFNRVEFAAQDVPGMGYKTYFQRKISADKSAANKTASDNAPPTPTPQPSPVPQGTTLENRFYRLELDPASGAIKSLYDKELNRELVDTRSPYRFGQYLYITGGDDTPTTTIQYSATNPAPAYAVTGASGGKLVSVEQTPEGLCAHLESSAPDQKISTEIRLIDDRKQVEITTEVRKQQVYHRESSYIAFPFAVENPQFLYEVQNGVVDPQKDMLPGAGLEWFSVQHWAAVQQGGVAGAVMPLDTPMLTLGDINRRLWPKEFGTRKATIFSYVYNNYHQPAVPLIDWHEEAKFDTFRVRQIVTSAAAVDPVELSRRGWEEVTPLEVNEVELRDKSWARPVQLDSKKGTFMTVDDPALLMEAWKPAEDGNGMILRFLDLGGADRKVTVELPLLNLKSAQKTDSVERNRDKIALKTPHSFQIDVHPREIVTVRVNGTPTLSPPIIPADKENATSRKPYSDF